MTSRHRTPEQRRLQSLLREIRKERGLTQSELAKKLNKPQSYVSKYESGERRLDLPEIERICMAVEIDLIRFVRRYQRG
jgi:transcriptional regulator with XRE-family HTH domain